jgi:imidazolonepropionase-like amidohydrolase
VIISIGMSINRQRINLETICSSTINVAEMMGWSDQVGEIDLGKVADFIVVIGLLQRVEFVMKGAMGVRDDSQM